MQNPSPKLKRLNVTKLTADYIEGCVGKGGQLESKTIKLRNDQWRLVIAAVRAADALANPPALSPGSEHKARIDSPAPGDHGGATHEG